MSPARKLEPIEEPRRPVHLRVIPEEPESPQLPAMLAAPADGDPFSPYKILNHFDRLSALVRGELVYPITVEIDPTNVCNHRCAWCVSIEAHNEQHISIERFNELVGQLKSLDVKSIVLKGGGEPTVHPRFPEMLDAAHAAGLDIGLITNGSFPRKGSVEKVLETCQWARVSLDAATPETHRLIHGTLDFPRIIENVRRLTSRASHTMVGLNFVAEPRNYREMAEFAEMGKRLGVAYVTIRCVFNPDQPLAPETRDEMRSLARRAKSVEAGGFRVFLGNFTDRYLDADPHAVLNHQKCLGPNLVGVVGGDGEVYACCFLRGNPQFSFGSIHRQSFDEIWKGDRRREVMDAVYAGKCGRVCAGGMTANRYNIYNDILNYLAAESKQHASFA